MDSALPSSRYGGGGGSDDRHYPNNPHYRGGGGRRRGGGGGSGGGYGNRGRGFSGRHNRHHPYNDRSGGGGGYRNRGGGGGGQRGNQFGPSQQDQHRDSVRLLQHLSAMLSRVGDIDAGANANHESADSSAMPCRAEVRMVAEQISDLTAVICSPTNLKSFFEYKVINATGPSVRTDVDMSYYQNNSVPSNSSADCVQAQDEAGILAHLLVSCASTLVLQTPTYATLTLALHEASKNAENGKYAGFAHRCVSYAMQCFSRDLDMLLLESLPHIKQQPTTRQHQYYQRPTAPSSTVLTQIQRAKTACRIKLILRYFAILGRLNIIQAWQDYDQASSTDSFSRGDGNHKLTVFGLFKVLVVMVTRLHSNNSATNTAAYILVLLVLSNIPYLMACGIPISLIQSLLQPLESVMARYQTQSPFRPSVGSLAVLLKDEPSDEGDGDDDDDEDSEDETADVQQQPVCDSLQDIWRTVQNLVKQRTSDVDDTTASLVARSTRFALWSDDPWNHIRTSKFGGQEHDLNVDEPSQDYPERLGFVELPVYLEFSQDCRVVPFVLRLDNDGSEMILSQHLTLDGIIFGRLPIFGSPPTPDDEDDNPDDTVEESEPSAYQLPESLKMYQKEIGWIDRCAVTEAVRDCILSYESTISPTGLERGTAKVVAERIWSIQQAWNQESDLLTHKKGLEYAILEALVSLVVQAPVVDGGVVRHLYVGRVLLELTRLQPTVVPQALVIAISNLFQDYMPSLAPYARDSVCRWMAFHLANTEYQWPAAYWRHWTSFVVADNVKSSRGRFVKRTLEVMASNVHDLERLSDESLPQDCELRRYLLPQSTIPNDELDDALTNLEHELQVQIWTNAEEPDAVCEFLLSGEVSERVASDHDGGDDWRRTWWRSLVTMRALLQPSRQEYVRLKVSVERAMGQREGNEEMDDSDERTSVGDDVDVAEKLLEYLPRFGSVLLAALKKDGEGFAEQQNLGGSNKLSDLSILELGEAYLLRVAQSFTFYSRTLQEVVVECLLQNKLVSAMGVFRWLLSDYGRDGKSAPSELVERWWELASIAIRVNCERLLSTKTGSMEVSDGIGMILDVAGEDAPADVKSQAKLLLDELSPMLQYTVNRVHTLLVRHDGSKKKLSSIQNELVEGTKYVVLCTHSLFFQSREAPQNSDGNFFNETVRLQELLLESDIGGAKLASSCGQIGSSSFSTDLLVAVLESI